MKKGRNMREREYENHQGSLVRGRVWGESKKLRKII